MSRPLQVPVERKARPRPSFECIALLLQGGGALGAYQAGVYQALSEADIHPDWVAGISIGAINAALIAGNPPEARVDKLRQFWEVITDPLTAQAETVRKCWDSIVTTGRAIGASDFGLSAAPGEAARGLANQVSASLAALRGVPAFFVPRLPIPWLQPAGTLGATSYYDTVQLRATLERLVDFDRI